MKRIVKNLMKNLKKKKKEKKMTTARVMVRVRIFSTVRIHAGTAHNIKRASYFGIWSIVSY